MIDILIYQNEARSSGSFGTVIIFCKIDISKPFAAKALCREFSRSGEGGIRFGSLPFSLGFPLKNQRKCL
jgi:hypothetical protein